IAPNTAEGINPLIAAFFGNAVKHVSSLTAVSPTFANEVLTHPTYLAAGDEFLLPRCASYVLNLAHLMVRGPGAEAQIQHRDRDIFPYTAHEGGEELLASIIALVDFTKDNGATGVVPGSHRWNPTRQATNDEIAYAEMRAGDAVIYLGSTIHFGGHNTTADQWRRGVHLSYCLGWLRTEENNYLGTPPSVAATLSPQAQALIGYSIHDAISVGGGYLGMVDMRNPLDMLADGTR
ncbi:MAG TPA: phytanoyl-CoA dioxygenase family protein, partial [Ilumatobacteraceae bacterium]|nr:phytanoyl-CoA dioxygenase family protein [Ilumatobacteraceae bacterium]